MQCHCNNVAFSRNVLSSGLCSPFVSLTMITNVSLITNVCMSIYDRCSEHRGQDRGTLRALEFVFSRFLLSKKVTNRSHTSSPVRLRGT